MQLVNLTAHDITIGTIDTNGEFQLSTKVCPSGKIARVATSRIEHESFGDILVESVRFLGVEDLPPAEDNVRYIVSMPVAQFAVDRTDLICPDSEKAFRKGSEILGVPGFVRYKSAPMKLSSEKRIVEAFKKFVNVGFQPVKFGICDSDGKFQETLNVPKSNVTAIVKSERVSDEAINEIPCFSIKFGEVENLPSKEPGVIYIAPMPVAQFSGRDDVYTADTEKAFREKGNIIGVPGIVYYVS